MSKQRHIWCTCGFCRTGLPSYTPCPQCGGLEVTEEAPPPLLASCARHSAARFDIAVDRPIVSPLTEWICSQSFVEGFPG